MHEFLGNHALVCLTGMINLVIGLLIVVSHNIWVAEWPVVVTIVGWVVLLQALMRIFFPDAFTGSAYIIDVLLACRAFYHAFDANTEIAYD